MSKISSDEVETTLKIGTHNLQNNTYFDRPRKNVNFPPHISGLWGEMILGSPIILWVEITTSDEGYQNNVIMIFFKNTVFLLNKPLKS